MSTDSTDIRTKNWTKTSGRNWYDGTLSIGKSPGGDHVQLRLDREDRKKLVVHVKPWELLKMLLGKIRAQWWGDTFGDSKGLSVFNTIRQEVDRSAFFGREE